MGTGAAGAVSHIGDRFRASFDDAAIGMSVTRLDGRYLRVNRAFCDLVGYDAEALLDMSLQDLTHPDDVMTGDEVTASAMERGEPSVFIDKRYVHADGRVIHVKVATAFMRDQQGRPQYFFTQILDVTALVEAQTAARAEQRRLERVISSAQAAYLEIDAHGLVRAWNPAAEEIFGWRHDQAVGMQVALLLAPVEQRAEYTAQIGLMGERLAGDRIAGRVEGTALHRDGHLIHTESTFWTIGDADDRTVHLFIQDISERHRHEAELRSSAADLAAAEERWRLTLDNAPTGVAVVGMDGRMVRVNVALCAMLGLTDEELLSRSFQDITHPDDQETGAEVFADLVAGRRRRTSFEKRYLHADGHEVWVRISTSLVRDGSGEPLHLISHIEDVTDHRASTERLREAAEQDPLTGLANRARFLAELTRTAERAGPDAPVAVLFLDLDGFKEVNDTWGHPQGDQLLRMIAGRLEGALRSTDLTARFGGDEFAVLLPTVRDPDDVETISAQLLVALARPYRLAADLTVRVSASIGGIASTDPTVAGAELVARADGAMYEAKRRGKNTFVMA